MPCSRIGGEVQVQAQVQFLVERFYDLMDLELDYTAWRAARLGLPDNSSAAAVLVFVQSGGWPPHYPERCAHSKPRLRHMPWANRQWPHWRCRVSLWRQAQRAELAGVGLLAGFLVFVVALAVGWALARYLLDIGVAEPNQQLACVVQAMAQTGANAALHSGLKALLFQTADATRKRDK